MKRAVLIANPAAGRAHRFRALLTAIIARLEAAGYTTQFFLTRAAAPLPELPACDLVLACGGDGTVHEVVQSMACTRSMTPLGILPLGTANALARNLRLPLDPLAALERLLTYQPVRLPLGLMSTSTAKRFFLLMAGCGPDGALIHSLSRDQKMRFGRSAYYVHAMKLFITRRWPAFEVTWIAQDGRQERARAIGLMAARIPDLGGAFTGLTRRASLTADKLHIQLIKPPAQLSLPAWFSLTRMGLPNPWLQTIEVDEVRCEAIGSPPVYAQADAEPMGPLPFTLRLIPDAITLLMPDNEV